MLKNYLKIAFRNLIRNKVSSFINISGLAVGMAVAMLIGLWMYDEISYNQYHQHYDKLAQVLQNQTLNNQTNTENSIPRPLEKAMRINFSQDFKYLSMATWTEEHILSIGEKKITRTGNFMQADFPEMLTLKMLQGTRKGLQNVHSVLLSESTAKALFGTSKALDKTVKIDNQMTVRVTGVYEDLPYNTSLKDLQFISTWDLYLKESAEWVREAENNWGNNSFQLFAQVADKGDMKNISEKIKNIKAKSDKEEAKFKPEIFLQPMSHWHLYSEFKNGKNAGGRIQYVWLFGMIGVFVLLLACINFMNLSTARSEKRAKEVGIRKVIGSVRGQLIGQFFCESLLTVLIAFMLSLLLVELFLPIFNQVADKQTDILWKNPAFWILSLGFILLTGLLSGSYPAFYLSSFQPVQVLKGTFKAGKYAALPRKILVVLQFTVSVILIIGIMVVYHQIQFTKNRPLGYQQQGVISLMMKSPETKDKLKILSDELKKNDAIVEIAQSSGPITDVWSNNGGFDWLGKDPALEAEFATVWVTHDFGKTINWKIKEGRDYSRDFASDSNAVIINEAAVKFMGIENPLGKELKWGKRNLKIIAIVKDILMQSPYEPVKHTVYKLSHRIVSFLHLKLNPQKSPQESLALIEGVFRKVIPAEPFDYKFIDEEFARKFAREEQIGKLSGVFALLAIFISCLGLFGLASYMAEKRAKEVGIRKVLGASVFSLWQLLSKEFVWLVLISFCIASPIAYYGMNQWLQNYTYRTEIAWWVFALTGIGIILITLFTVSYQAIKAAMVNPVEVLKNE